jgi:DNA-binding response OmpR family regulator
MAGELILLVDDEASIRSLQRMYLERDGFRVEECADGLSALAALKRLRPALVVLDIMLPGLDGLEILRRLRSEDDPTAVIMVTARDEDIDRILGLEMGADDYLSKPFNPRELTARVRAILRRSERPAAPSPGEPLLQLGNLVLDPASREVRVGAELIACRHQEFNLLRVLLEHKNLVLTRDQLLNLAWGYDYPGQTRTVDVHIGQLRKKLAGSQVKIETVTSDGYKLVLA